MTIFARKNWPVFLVLLTVYFSYIISQFLRLSTGVIGVPLREELYLSVEETALLSSSFFLSFALAQIPVGLFLDMYGPRKIALFSLVLVMIGCLILVFAPNFHILLLSRLVLGVACSSFLMGPLLLFSRWFKASLFATLTGIHIGIGNIGALLATEPLAILTESFSWRTGFYICLGFTSLVLIMTYIFVYDTPDRQQILRKKTVSLWTELLQYRQVMTVPSFWPVFILGLFNYAMVVSILSLWGSPYLVDVYGFSLSEAGNFLLVISISVILGSFIIPPLDRILNTRKWIVIASISIQIVCIISIGLVDKLEDNWLFLWCIIFGFAAGGSVVLIAHGRSLFEDIYIGRGNALINMATIGGVFLMQSVTGYIGEIAASQTGGILRLDGYQTIFSSIACITILPLLIYLFLALDKPPSENA